MTRIGLSQEEIKKRLIRLRNLGVLHENQRFKIWHLRDENRELKKEIIALKVVVSGQQKTIDDLKLQVEELRTIVFGRKKHKDKDDIVPQKETIERTSDSYRRPIPKDTDVTETKLHTLNQCLCGTTVTNKQTIVFYEEDIPMPAKKIVRKHIVEKAYCLKCKQWRTAYSLPNHKVILGKNVQKYICYLNVLCRLSFSQVQHVLKDTYQLNVSEGEIAKILQREAIHLGPFYEQLKAKIRGEPSIHLDETGWKLLRDGEQCYSWVMSGTKSKESVFLVGESRGKGNASNLLGNFSGFVVTDDYGAYRTLKNHQLCWAHLMRKFRDIATSGELEEKIKIHCRAEDQKLCLIYDDVKNDRRVERHNDFSLKLKELSEIRHFDPMKLIRIKTTLRKNIPNYLTCLSDPCIPLTNNQAERSLRHLVLKRKISFGSLTKETAGNLAVLVSVMLSLKQRCQSNFFGEYLRV